jgi:L-lactate dehydrogenase (cytochrome)
MPVVLTQTDKYLGEIEPSTTPTQPLQDKQHLAASESPLPYPRIETCLNLHDFELAAKELLSAHAWVYYSSAAQDRRSYDNNINDWARLRFRPRVMRDVKKVDTGRSILGFQSSFPFFIAPCALGRLGHHDGELCLARGAARANIPYCPSNSSSVSHHDLAQCLSAEMSGGRLFFQLYVKRSKAETIENIERARRLGYKALVITVDANAVGIREDDDRRKIRETLASGQEYISPWRAASTNPNPESVLRAPHSSTLNWTDLSWIREAWQNAGPVCVKGILTAEDAKIACDHGVDAVYLSNHGGRQLDAAPSGLAALMEIQLFYPKVLERCEILLDGGVRRGAHVIQALCLGATAVGLGRPFMYAMGAYGTDGVHKAIESESPPHLFILVLFASISIPSAQESTTDICGSPL